MRSLLRIPKNDKGSITVEAALALPIFMALMLLIASIARVYQVHEMVQDALSDAVNEVASTAYLFEVTGFLDVHSEINDAFAQTAEPAQADFELVLDCMDIAQKASGAAKGGDLDTFSESASDASGAAEAIKESAQNIVDDPMQYAKSIVSVGALHAMDEAQNYVMSTYIKMLMHKHLKKGDTSADERLEAFNVIDGFGGLSFEESTYFEDGEDMDVKVTYTLSKVDPFGFVKNITLTNHVKARVWVGGEGEVPEVASGEDEESTEESVENESLDDDSDTNDEEETVKASMYITKSGTKFHFNHTPDNPCSGNMGNAYIVNGDLKDEPGWENDVFYYNGKAYTYCKNCAKETFKK